MLHYRFNLFQHCFRQYCPLLHVPFFRGFPVVVFKKARQTLEIAKCISANMAIYVHGSRPNLEQRTAYQRAAYFAKPHDTHSTWVLFQHYLRLVYCHPTSPIGVGILCTTLFACRNFP